MGCLRIGTLSNTDGAGRHFTWVIHKFSTIKINSKWNSQSATTFQKTKFRLHMSLDEPGYVGFYVNFKKHPIPKYSYYFENLSQESMRQHTAHTIPPTVNRCGHWSVCNRDDMVNFLGNDDVLAIHFIIDNDTISLTHLSQQKKVLAMWTIPKLYEQNLNPFTSMAFTIGNASVVARIDSRRKNSDLLAKVTPDNINSFVIFLFSPTQTVPPHGIELYNPSGKVYAEEKIKPPGVPQTLIVDRNIVDESIKADGGCRIRFTFSLINPLDALNHRLAIEQRLNVCNRNTGAEE